MLDLYRPSLTGARKPDGDRRGREQHRQRANAGIPRQPGGICRPPVPAAGAGGRRSAAGRHLGATTVGTGVSVVTTTPSQRAGALEAIGSSLYRESASSGPAVLVDPGTEGAGRLQGGTLEMANTDLAEKFSSSVVVQRAFQMNLAALRQADEMLELLARLGR